MSRLCFSLPFKERLRNATGKEGFGAGYEDVPLGFYRVRSGSWFAVVHFPSRSGASYWRDVMVCLGII